MNLRLRILGVVALVLALSGVWATSSWLGGLLFAGGLEKIGSEVSADYAFFLLVANLLDLPAYGALALVGFGFIAVRDWARRAGFYVGLYFTVMMTLEAGSEYVLLVRPSLEKMRTAGLPAPPPALILLYFTEAGLMLALAAVLIALGVRRGARASVPGRAGVSVPPFRIG